MIMNIVWFQLTHFHLQTISIAAKVEVPITDNLSISAYMIWKICWEIELNVCGNKNEEECKKEEFIF